MTWTTSEDQLCKEHQSTHSCRQCHEMLVHNPLILHSPLIVYNPLILHNPLILADNAMKCFCSQGDVRSLPCAFSQALLQQQSSNMIIMRHTVTINTSDNNAIHQHIYHRFAVPNCCSVISYRYGCYPLDPASIFARTVFPLGIFPVPSSLTACMPRFYTRSAQI
jgi:hypothetical protein